MSTASLADVHQRGGDRIVGEGEVRPRRCDDLGSRGLPVILLELVVGHRLGLGAVLA